ncbi:MAG: hypothetical protein RBS57_08935 [Desulforhabdus sp.]|jgi:hypothetical protein|nr:hypothetical protein [Desulforhabdus sp.]
MRKLIFLLAVVFLFVGCSTGQIRSSQDTGVKPDAFCNVVQEPDPLLLGTWECYFVRDKHKDIPDNNYVKYTLTKHGDDYGLYFFRTWRRGRKKVMEWKTWTINDKDISGEPQFGVRLFVQGNDVYFTIRGLDEPVTMTRVED